MTREATKIKPAHPGEVLLEEFLKPMGLTQRELADGIQVPYRRINDIVNGHQRISPVIALRLGKFLNTSAVLWMNLQQNWDLLIARQEELKILNSIQQIDLRARSEREK